MFVAVWPDDATVERLASLNLETSEGLRVVGPGGWHITLRFLGAVDDGLVPPLIDVLESAAASMPGALRCRLGPNTAWFSGGRVLQIPARGLVGLAAAVRVATLPVVPDPDLRGPPFNGHLTLARSKGRHLDSSARAAVAGLPFAAAFDIDSFDLVASEPADDGPVYRTLATIWLPG